MCKNQLSSGSIELLYYTIHQKQQQERDVTEEPTNSDNNSNLSTPFRAVIAFVSSAADDHSVWLMLTRLLCLFIIIWTLFSFIFFAFAFLSFSHGLSLPYTNKHQCIKSCASLFLILFIIILKFCSTFFGLCTN